MTGSLHTVALLEAIYSSAAVYQLLSAGEERMALAADFDLELTLGGAGNEGLSAGAAYDCFAIRRMDIFLHVLSPNKSKTHFYFLNPHTSVTTISGMLFILGIFSVFPSPRDTISHRFPSDVG